MPKLSSDAVFHGKRMALTGRLASMSRAEAIALIKRHGGCPVARVTTRTSLIVVGQDGWPLQKDGRLTNKLRKARSLQRAGYEITVLPEQEFLGRLNRRAQRDGVRRLHSTAELSRLLKIPGDRLRRWLAGDLIHAVETVDGLSYFGYSEVVSAKMLCELLEQGITTATLRRSIRQLRAWLGDVKQPLLQLAALEKQGGLLVRTEGGLADPTGQCCFDFTAHDEAPTVTLARDAPSADQWFELGCTHEDAGRMEEAAAAYRQALLAGGPTAIRCFNLANVLRAQGKKPEAAERFYQAVELDGGWAEAWNNLGVVLSELGRRAEATGALERAIAVDADYADAHYNLADLLEEAANPAKARTHWKAYLRFDQQSPWAARARQRLSALGG